ncbi:MULTISPECIES: arsenate reductase/protein-tyrosine-phosphatase family protein [Methylomonas]|uniref:arsenate reductase/protein-tyrosine-phosphatase family protein n=1 Tax=Methylomonas TaxID=416 RepID=UPI001231E94F|nr:phosphotyrosine protein phosphatase [Methylomonas rhizoryzae]
MRHYPTAFFKRIDTHFGTYRGLIRLGLAWLDYLSGRYDRQLTPDLSKVERLVFVCLGNVCRSPYAELIARESGLPAVSLGLASASGQPAYGPAIDTAKRRGRDLAAHRATDIGDFVPRDGDLYLVMEARQIERLRNALPAIQADIALLGLWARPMQPHIHDPMNLDPDYFINCYKTIENAVKHLSEDYVAARSMR